MTRAILGAAVALAAAAVLAGCGGSGTAAMTTNGVAGARTTKARPGFSAEVQGIEAQLQTAVAAFRSGNVGAAASSGSGLLTSCVGKVNALAVSAKTRQQKSAVTYLRVSCTDMTEAAQAGAKGKTGQAKSLAVEALKQAQLAVRQLR